MNTNKVQKMQMQILTNTTHRWAHTTHTQSHKHKHRHRNPCTPHTVGDYEADAPVMLEDVPKDLVINVDHSGPTPPRRSPPADGLFLLKQNLAQLTLLLLSLSPRLSLLAEYLPHGMW